MEIIEVKSKRQYRAFIDFPKQLYKDCPHYVPPMDGMELKTMTEHPTLAFCEARYWLAYRDGKVVGRIGAIINHKSNEMKGQKRIRFSWFDLIDDIEVARALVHVVEEWGAQEGLTEICGPSRFSNLEKQAMLIECFDVTPSICADYNYPYYPKLLEQLGFEKEVDYVQYRMKVETFPPRFAELAEKLSQRYHVRLRTYKNKEQLSKAGKEFFAVLNESYANIFNFIPLTEAEIDWAIKDFFQFADPSLASILEDEQGRLVNFAFCLPSLSEAFQKAKGKILPFGWYHVLKALRKNDKVDMYLTGVSPDYKNSGIHLIYHKQLQETFIKRGYQYAIASQQLEDNKAVNIWQRYDSELFCRRRCYKKDIKP